MLRLKERRDRFVANGKPIPTAKPVKVVTIEEDRIENPVPFY